ncbi:MAG: DNA replication/repair protein RecF, partial [Pseudomonadota bacterium]
AGKTNILEGVSLLGPGRGLRTARLDELPRFKGAGGWAISARLFDGEDERALGVGVDASRPDRRVCRIDESAASGPSAFADHMRMLWLTPAMDRLFMEGASERRRFLDRMTLAHHTTHGKRASHYEQAMRQRQRLLEDGARDDAWLSALERQMAEAGADIERARLSMIDTLTAQSVADALNAFPAADISLESGFGELASRIKTDDAIEAIATHLCAHRRRDAEAGRALTGPHRSDLIVHHRQKSMPARKCSTGEQKALLIGLVLANARAHTENSSCARLILLLDEIAAHLDPDRRASLFEILDSLGVQCFLTGTDAALFSAWGSNAQHFKAQDGRLLETNPC